LNYIRVAWAVVNIPHRPKVPSVTPAPVTPGRSAGRVPASPAGRVRRDE